MLIVCLQVSATLAVKLLCLIEPFVTEAGNIFKCVCKQYFLLELFLRVTNVFLLLKALLSHVASSI